MREIWHIHSTHTEICFDTNPGRPDIMEIESKTEEGLTQTINLLGMNNVPHDDFTDASMYENYFGIVIPKSMNMTFETIKETLGPLCTKNIDNFNNLVDEQLQMLEQIKHNSIGGKNMLLKKICH